VEIELKNECPIPFLSYVLAHDEPLPSNSQELRAIYCIYVNPAVHSAQGGHECYNIATGKIINHRCVTIALTTSTIIAAVEAAAHPDKMDKLHFKFKHRIILYDSSQIAGVDYNADALQNEDDILI